MIRIRHPWGVGPWMRAENLPLAQRWCDQLNAKSGIAVHEIQHANVLQRAWAWAFTNVKDLIVLPVAGTPNIVGLCDSATDSLAAIKHPSIMLDTVAAHIEGRGGIDTGALRRFADHMTALADRRERLD